MTKENLEKVNTTFTLMKTLTDSSWICKSFQTFTDCVHIENDTKFTDWDQSLIKTEQFENVIQSEKGFYGFKWKR